MTQAVYDAAKAGGDARLAAALASTERDHPRMIGAMPCASRPPRPPQRDGLAAEGQAAVAQLSPVHQEEWWDSAQPCSRLVAHQLEAARAEDKIRDEVRTRTASTSTTRTVIP